MTQPTNITFQPPPPPPVSLQQWQLWQTPWQSHVTCDNVKYEQCSLTLTMNLHFRSLLACGLSGRLWALRARLLCPMRPLVAQAVWPMQMHPWETRGKPWWGGSSGRDRAAAVVGLRQAYYEVGIISQWDMQCNHILHVMPQRGYSWWAFKIMTRLLQTIQIWITLHFPLFSSLAIFVGSFPTIDNGASKYQLHLKAFHKFSSHFSFR